MTKTTLDKKISFRVTREQYETLCKAAKSKKLSLSEYLIKQYFCDSPSQNNAQQISKSLINICNLINALPDNYKQDLTKEVDNLCHELI